MVLPFFKEPRNAVLGSWVPRRTWVPRSGFRGFQIVRNPVLGSWVPRSGFREEPRSETQIWVPQGTQEPKTEFLKELGSSKNLAPGYVLPPNTGLGSSRNPNLGFAKNQDEQEENPASGSMRNQDDEEEKDGEENGEEDKR
ncbi:hypothetical protein SLEP1_g10938 [Rubroshorea leprosula]|uniref:Uncharacterized protein n=1 Tax=Rubroshorea leprosula TaxID=152421 RepID=A0AAV5IE65_9ROSI|nr:hypothetical protein SLEP1_g10938 [Rubroshorea leprosula]